MINLNLLSHFVLGYIIESFLSSREKSYYASTSEREDYLNGFQNKLLEEVKIRGFDSFDSFIKFVNLELKRVYK
ncbi:MAG TPA: hypothetical protein VI815_02310 [Candidatus Nanoarchaeia archaeon]|nr:hypothetical protein [Candidatus Nanoarchaeia archaeon]